MVKKMSPTKQIEAMLDTPDKTKQVERIQQLIQVADLPGVAVTVLFSHGQVRIGVTGTDNVNSKQAKALLQEAINQLTRQEVMSEVQQAEPPDVDPAGIRKQLQDYADENPDKQVFDGEHLPVPPRK